MCGCGALLFCFFCNSGSPYLVHCIIGVLSTLTASVCVCVFFLFYICLLLLFAMIVTSYPLVFFCFLVAIATLLSSLFSLSLLTSFPLHLSELSFLLVVGDLITEDDSNNTHNYCDQPVALRHRYDGSVGSLVLGRVGESFSRFNELSIQFRSFTNLNFGRSVDPIILV